jgi:hypothetical protein
MQGVGEAPIQLLRSICDIAIYCQATFGNSGFRGSQFRIWYSACRRCGNWSHGCEAYAENLIADGYRVTTFDCGPGRTAALASVGAEVASSLLDLAVCDVVLTALPDDEAVKQVALEPGGLVHVLRRGAIHVAMSTVSPTLSRRLAEEHRFAGQSFVAAPCLATPISHTRGSCS